MLNIKLDEAEGIDTFEMEGDFSDILAEATFVISQIYKQIYRGNPMVADAFKSAVQIAVGGDDSPMWDTAETMPGTVIVMPKLRKGE
jgi:hypothetical protein